MFKKIPKRKKLSLALGGVFVLVLIGFLSYNLISGRLQSWAATLSGGNVYYVSPTGNDANPGTIDAPWGTLQYAVDHLQAGDTLYLREGTYYTVLYPGYQPSIGLLIARSGTDSARITIASYPGEHAIINNTQLTGTLWDINVTGSYITIKDLEISDSFGRETTVATFGSHLIIENNIFQRAAYDQIRLKTGQDIIIRNNEFHGYIPGGDVSACQINSRANDVIIEHNHFYKQGPQATMGDIMLKGTPKRNIIRYNTFVKTGPSAGVAFLFIIGGVVGGVPNLTEDTIIHDNIIYNYEPSLLLIWNALNTSVYNNTFFQSPDDLYRTPVMITPSAQNTTIMNNIFYGDGISRWNSWLVPGKGLMAIGDTTALPQGLSINNNLWYSPNNNYVVTYGGVAKTFSQYIADTGLDSNSIVAKDPLFADLTNQDFHLKASSPAIDAGATPLQNWLDFDGVSRPQGGDVDIGAYEYVSGAPTIVNVNVSNITETSATISFGTSELTRAVLDYGTGLGYGSQLEHNTLSITHSFSLTGLTKGTTYHFRITVTDADGTQSKTSDRTFETAGAIQPTPTPTQTVTATPTATPTPTPSPTSTQTPTPISLNLSLFLQGRTDKTTSGTTLKIFAQGQATPLFEKTDLATSSAGTANITIATLSSGNYDILIKPPGYLSKKLTNQSLSASANLSFGELKAGDLNNDNLVNSFDFAMLNSKWNQQDPLADINQDAIVNTFDFAYLNSNWFLQGG